MKKKPLLAILFLALTLAGCAHPLEKGWKKEDEGKKTAAIKDLSQALIDSDSTYRRLAAEELIKLGKPAVPALTTVLLRRGHYYDIYYSGARKEAAWALGEIGSREAVPALLRSLQAAEENYREKDLISDIKDLNSRAGLARMAKDVAARSQGKDLIAIAKTMKKDLEEVERVIQEAFNNKNSFYHEKELISAINRIQSLPLKGEGGKKVKEETLKIVKKWLELKRTSGPPELITGIEALGKIGDRQAVGPLVDMLQETYTRAAAALALGKIGDRKAIPFLEEALRKEKEDSIKTSLEAALYLLGDKSKWEVLVSNLKEEKLRRGTIKLLGETGDEKGIKPLVETLSDKSPEVRAEAIKALSQIGRGGRATKEALLRALNDNNPEVKKEAILAIVKSEKAAKVLQGILQDKGEELSIRLAATSRLGGWGDKSGLPLAVRVAKGKTFSDGERAIAITALGRMGKGKDVLRKIYQDREESDLMRFDARQALQGREER